MPSTNLHVSQHPAVLHKLAILRDENTEPKKFREVVRELSWLLGYEALADVGVRPLEIRTPMEAMTAHELDARIGLVPILWATGTGSEIMKRIAAPMVGGIVTSFILELLVYPAVYLVWRESALQKESGELTGDSVDATGLLGLEPGEGAGLVRVASQQS